MGMWGDVGGGVGRGSAAVLAALSELTGLMVSRPGSDRNPF